MTTTKGKPVVDVDLDALRKAHADGKRTKTFRLGGEVFQVGQRLPIYVAVLLGEGEIRSALKLWLGEEQEQRFSLLDLDQDDLQLLIRELYVVDLPNSSASADS